MSDELRTENARLRHDLRESCIRAVQAEAQRDAAKYNETEIRKYLYCRIEAADRNAAERDAARALAARLAEVLGTAIHFAGEGARGRAEAALADARAAKLAGEGGR